MKNILKNIYKEGILFLIGGGIYIILECMWRGYSHKSMFIVGGICFAIVGLINEVFTEDMSLLFQAVVGSLIVTTLEFVSGYILNIKLGLDVWDYSNLPYNFMGQICLPFSLLWIIISAVAVIVDDEIREFVFDEPHVTYHLFPNKNKKKIK